MWIRNQKRNVLAKVDMFEQRGTLIYGFQGPDDAEGIILGEYESSERAYAILNLLQNNTTRGFTSGNMPLK